MLELTPQGIHCPEGGFHVDPSRAVEHAVITHAHSDHARRGSRNYYCAESSARLLRCRLGEKIRVHAVPFGTTFTLGKARLSFHPAGHILGSAQVRIESEGRVWVVSGDYKREPDPTCEPFELVRCDAFVTEATFGTPSYRWKPNAEIGKKIFEWWQENSRDDVTSVLHAYSLGKAQRVLGELLDLSERPIFVAPQITAINECYRAEGVKLAETRCLSQIHSRKNLRGELILVPPSSMNEDLFRRIGPHRTAFASGWMSGGSRGYDKGFQLSDHADWDALTQTIEQTGAKEVYVLHRNGVLIRYLRRILGIQAFPAEALKPGADKGRAAQLQLF